MAEKGDLQYRYIADTRGKEAADRWLQNVKAKELKRKETIRKYAPTHLSKLSPDEIVRRAKRAMGVPPRMNPTFQKAAKKRMERLRAPDSETLAEEALDKSADKEWDRYLYEKAQNRPRLEEGTETCTPFQENQAMG